MLQKAKFISALKKTGTFGVWCCIWSFLSFVLLSSLPFAVQAAPVPDPIIYEGRLLDTAQEPITTEHDFRFSFWSSSDYVEATDNNAGAINNGSGNYSGWQEVQAITPSTFGTFTIKLGQVSPLPEIDFSVHKYLQVEVKASGDPDTAYQLLDPTGDNGLDTTDRKMIGSVPYAKVAGTSGNTNQERLILDADDTISNAGTGSVQLQFGTTLGKILEYDIDNGYFRFTDDVRIEGALTVTGLINGVDVSAASHAQNTDTGTDSSTFIINTGGPQLIFDSSGLSGDRTVSFTDANTVVVGETNSQTLTNKTINGDNNTITNIDISSLKDRNRSILLSPEMENISVNPDGTANMVTLNQGYDEANNERYYVLSSDETAQLNDLDMILPFVVPDDFSSWQATPMQITVRSSSLASSENQIDAALLDTSNAAVSLVGGTDLMSEGAPEAWTQKNITFSGTPTFTAGESATIKLKLQAKSGNRIYIGPIRLHYVGK